MSSNLIVINWLPYNPMLSAWTQQQNESLQYELSKHIGLGSFVTSWRYKASCPWKVTTSNAMSYFNSHWSNMVASLYRNSANIALWSLVIHTIPRCLWLRNEKIPTLLLCYTERYQPEDANIRGVVLKALLRTIYGYKERREIWKKGSYASRLPLL